MADSEKLTVAEDETPARNNKLIIMLAAALLTVAVVASGAYFVIGGDDAALTEAEERQQAQSLYYKLEKPFIVNIHSDGRQRYMQIGVAIKGKDPQAMQAIEKHEPVIKNDLNQLFSSQELAVLQTPKGLQKLNQEATEIVQAFLQKEIGTPGIDQVLFENFVMQ